MTGKIEINSMILMVFALAHRRKKARICLAKTLFCCENVVGKESENRRGIMWPSLVLLNFRFHSFDRWKHNKWGPRFENLWTVRFLFKFNTYLEYYLEYQWTSVILPHNWRIEHEYTIYIHIYNIHYYIYIYIHLILTLHGKYGKCPNFSFVKSSKISRSFSEKPLLLTFSTHSKPLVQ